VSARLDYKRSEQKRKDVAYVHAIRRYSLCIVCSGYSLGHGDVDGIRDKSVGIPTFHHYKMEMPWGWCDKDTETRNVEEKKSPSGQYTHEPVYIHPK
jgi:hypothetical protein